ncbi:Demethylspheroidene O-methyltransferase [Jannaschia pagri]|uniref:Demethylspheroidene O-methyltransferase n=1 Tax=Jannaschia pagri TaxID=2829797 RepID=A0ABQ4NLZ7_9RHOB|nr:MULTISPECIES: methyltransferase [unclassified Jannaschia]GIT91400.1 Demethylspheroidene O-methyltransferase [Jannaschia sp. AI_61]GIT95234.1 Demethylspheroidene O-methyltransferase [Jannaschia sp. AI_62]
MTLAEPSPQAPRGPGWALRLVASRRFQSFCAAVPCLRRIARRDGEALFDLVGGFVHSQVLFAVVELRLLHRLFDGPATAPALARGTALTADRIEILCNAAVSLGLMRRTRDGYGLARKGAAILGVPGLEAMISHHHVLYRDLADPLAVLGGAETELSKFWPYVFGAAAAQDPDTARRYSDLMSDSQGLVAEETLRRCDLSKAGTVLDIGGGTGAFLSALGQRHGAPALHLFDLPPVVSGARDRFAATGLTDRVQITAGSFRDDPLPVGADVITLVRVLYDHSDTTVMDLLRAVHAALPEGGRLVVSEPMTGGDRPHPAGDAYFAFYCMAMGTGRARSPQVIREMMGAAGFASTVDHGTTRPFVTHVLSAEK